MEAAAPPPPEQPPPPAPVAAAGAYPVRVDAEHQDEYNRFLPLVKWLLAIPHFVVLAFLFIGVLVAHVIAFFAVLFTGRWPEGLFNYIVNVYRWSWKVTSYIMLLHDEYPPFSLHQEGWFPASLEVDPPGRIANWRPLVQWLLVLPYAILAGLLGYVAGFMWLVGIFVILFTGRLPEGMFKLILIPNRWNIRAYMYAGFLTDRYPPFEWDE